MIITGASSGIGEAAARALAMLAREDVPEEVGRAFMEVLGGKQGLQVGRELRKGRKRLEEEVGETGMVGRLGVRVVGGSEERECGVEGETFDELLVVFVQEGLEMWDRHLQF